MTSDQRLTTDYRLQTTEYALLTTAALWFLVVFWATQWLAPRLPGPSVLGVLGSALLVMGCYGHSRTREWVLGGASRTVLTAMTLPVLMVH